MAGIICNCHLDSDRQILNIEKLTGCKGVHIPMQDPSSYGTILHNLRYNRSKVIKAVTPGRILQILTLTW